MSDSRVFVGMVTEVADGAKPLCQCGCGQLAPIAAKTSLQFGHVKGRPIRYVHGHNTASHRRTYALRSVNGKQKLTHVIVAEAALGRSLPDGVEVHHVDGDKRHNANRNLVICQDHAYHALLHVRARVLRAGGDPNTQVLCGRCGTPQSLDAFRKANGNNSTGRAAKCRRCEKATRAERWERLKS